MPSAENFFRFPQWVHFQTMLITLLVTTFKPTVCGRMQVLAFGTHRTKHNEFLQRHSSLLTRVLQFYAMHLVHLMYRPGERLFVILDNTKAFKRGKSIEASFRFFDHVTNRYGS